MPQFYQYVQQTLPKQTIDSVDIEHVRDLLIVKSREFIAIPEHISDDFNINIVPSSPPPLTINRKDLCFNKKCTIVMPPGISIASKHNASTQDYFLLSISKNRFKDVLSNISPSINITKTMSFPYSRTLFSSAQSLFSELENKYLGYDLMVQSKLTEFIIMLIRESRLSENREKAAGRNYNYTERALEYIHSYSNADISLDDLCTELNLSRYHFIRIFKAHTGTTPHAYLLDLRLTHSMQYLKKKDYSLSEVASLCGFMSQAHYSQCFRKKYGVTPTHFRDLDKS